MAVQAQYPSNGLLLNRNVQESKNGIGGGFLEESHTFFNNNGVGVNPRKRSREDATTTKTHNSLNLSLKNQQENQNNNQFIDLSQLQNQNQHQNVVSTGLKLSFGEQIQQQKQQQIQQYPRLLSRFSEEFALQFKQHNDELNYFLHAQGEQLKRTLAEKRQRHYCALLVTAKEEVARRLREKEIEVETAMKRNVELHGRMAQINAEAQAWQIKAMGHEAQAVSLKAQIQHVMVSGPQQQNNDGGGIQSAEDADDARSAYVDPASERGVKSSSCHACQTRVASVVLLPCRHMCVCVKCDKFVQACPMCCSIRSASVEVYFT